MWPAALTSIFLKIYIVSTVGVAQAHPRSASRAAPHHGAALKLIFMSTLFVYRVVTIQGTECFCDLADSPCLHSSCVTSVVCYTHRTRRSDRPVRALPTRPDRKAFATFVVVTCCRAADPVVGSCALLLLQRCRRHYLSTVTSA
jgi:hypothetical protein